MNYQTPIESIVTCSLQMNDDQGNILTVYGDIYTVYSRAVNGYRYKCVLDTSENNFPDCEWVKSGILVYKWKIVDKHGNKVKSYTTRNRVTDEFINDYFSREPESIRYLPAEYKHLVTFKKRFYDRVYANMNTYENMGFHMHTGNPNDIKAEVKTTKYRIAFSHKDTGKMITRDRYIYPRENESVKDVMVKALCSDYTCSPVDSVDVMLDNLEYMLNGNYVGVYKV